MKSNVIEKLESGHYRGNYKVWGKPRLDFDLVQNNKATENAPDFMIVATDPLGDKMEIGSAYLNQIETGNKAGQIYFAINFNEPTVFRNSLKMVAFTDNGAFWSITPSKPKEQGEFEQGQAAQAA